MVFNSKEILFKKIFSLKKICAGFFFPFHSSFDSISESPGALLPDPSRSLWGETTLDRSAFFNALLKIKNVFKILN